MFVSSSIAAPKTEAPGITSSPGPEPRSWLPYALAVALIAALAVGLTTFSALQGRQHDRELTIVATQNIARLLEQSISSEFDKADIVLQSAAAHYREQTAAGRLDPARLNTYLAQQQALIPQILSLHMTDKNGTVSYGDDIQPGNPLSLANLDYFIRMRNDPQAGLVIAGPLLSRDKQQWVIVLARRVFAADGSFAGIVYANFSTRYFETILSSPALGPAGAATLRTSMMALVHRVPDTKNAVGSTDVSTQLREIMAGQSEAGDYLAVTALDGIERSNAYRKLAHYPFYVIVGLATKESPGEWKSNALTLGGLATLMILASGLAALALYRNARRQALDLAARRLINTELRAALDEVEDLYNSSPGGYHSLGPDGTLLRINDTELCWLGYQRSELIGQKRMTALLTPASQILFRENFARLKQMGVVRDLKVDMVRKDGSILPALINATAVADEHGAFLMSRTTVLDLSEVQLAEFGLQEAQRIAQVGSWEHDLASDTMLWSAEMLRIFALDSGSTGPTHEAWLERVHPQDRAATDQAYRDALRDRLSFDLTHRLLLPGGEVRYVHVRGELFFATDGRPLRSAGTVQDVTLALQRTAALAESERRFRTLVDDNNAVILQIDPASGRIRDANASACAFYGWSRAQLCTMGIADINQLAPHQVAAERKAVVNGLRNCFVFPHRCASGEIRTVEVHSTPIVVDGHTLLVSIIHDISKRILDAAQIERLRREQAAILDSHLVGFVKIKERSFVWCNEALAAMLGYTREELTGQATRMIYPDDQAHAAMARAAYPQIQRGEVFRSEIRYRRKDGFIGWYELSGASLSPESGESIWALIDITARKGYEIALAAGEKRLRDIFATMSEGLVLFGTSGNITDANESACDILGLSRDELMGSASANRPWQVIHEDGTPLLHSEHPARVTLRSGQPQYDRTIGFHSPTRGLRWVRLNSSPICAPGDAGPNAVLVTFSDITEQRAQHAQLRGAYERLEALNDEQAVLLRRLADELTCAEQRERDHLFALLHDELQPMLVAARLSLSSLTLQTAPEISLQIAAMACAHISQVLAVARTLSTELNPPLMREQGLIPALQSLFRWVQDNHRLSVELMASPDLEPEDMAIRICCIKVVRELLLNVVKHAGTTRARVELQLDDQRWLNICVSDDGSGFDPSVVTSGSGLSSMVGRLKMFGGRLQINSRAGQTRITASLPLNASPQAEQDEQHEETGAIQC